MIGFVTCVHPFYELPAVLKHRDEAITQLRAAGLEVYAPPVPRTASDAVEIAAALRSSGAEVALLFFCTWVAEDITLALARELMDVPMLIWALPYLDQNVPMPSPMSGFISSASNIRRLGKPFAWLVGHVTPERVGQAVRGIRTATVAAQLRRARFGIVGDPCPGMLDVAADEAELGVIAVHLSLDTLLEAAQASSRDEAVALARQLIAETGSVLTEEAVADNLQLYLGMRRLVREHQLDGYCVRCWPELRDQHRKTVCLAHSLLAGEGIASSCEVDLPALVTTWLLSRLAGTPAFCLDITGYLEAENAIQFAHCGAAGRSLAANARQIQLRSHMRTATGATVEFPFKQGTVTLAKLLRPANGAIGLFAERGTVLPAHAAVRGSVALVRPEPSAPSFLERVVRDSVEHHFALVYGDWLDDLARFCEFTGMALL